MIKRAFTDIQSTQSWQEIIPDEETKENEIVNDALKVEFHSHLCGKWLILEEEVFSKNGDLN